MVDSLDLGHHINRQDSNNLPQPSTPPTIQPTTQPPQSSRAKRTRKRTKSTKPRKPRTKKDPPRSPPLDRPAFYFPSQRYVTLIFTDPIPSTLGKPSFPKWTPPEQHQHRRLIAFTVLADKENHDDLKGIFTVAPIPHLSHTPPKSQVISCIHIPAESSHQLRDQCIITQYDMLRLLQWMLGSPSWFLSDEKNRIRRNLQYFNPTTMRKVKAIGEIDVFGQIVGYKEPKPYSSKKNMK